MTPRARIITMAWGQPYFDTLRSLALPAVLAPGNLPSFASMLDCEMVIVTEHGFFEELRTSPVFRRIEEHCPVKLVMMDDLVVSAGRYGMALSFALHRGLADLGDAMTDQYFIFFNADFILADGSLRTLGHRVLAGEQLIHAPSYCVIRERTEARLRQSVDPATQALIVSPRAMAEMILANRHYTIRGKTVNQRVFHSAYIEQFYWQVDDYTLLGRQMPIALVAMKPERVVREMRTFWDYGVVSEFCPSAKPCVLGDSDEFCILELRRETTMLEQMALGWPTPEEIAHVLGKFVTEDQKKLGRYPLVLHSRELPRSLEGPQRDLADFVERVYSAMPERAVPHLNHPFWLDHYAPFLAEQARYFASRSATPPTANQAASSVAPVAPSAATPRPAQRLEPKARLRSSLRTALGEFKARFVGRMPFVRVLHPYYTVVTPTYERLERKLALPAQRILVVSDQNGPLSQFLRERSREAHTFYEAPNLLQADVPAAAAATLEEVLRRGPFDLLVSEVTFSGLLKFSELFSAVQSAMAQSSLVVVFHLNTAMTTTHISSEDVITRGTIATGRSDIFFSGSEWARRAVTLLKRAGVMRRSGRLGVPASVVLMGASLISAAIASWRQSLVTRAVPKTCLAMTMCYELPRSSEETTTAA